MQKYLIDSLLKKNLVNTIVGPSGSGKSKWVTQQLAAMASGEPFFGYPTTPLPETFYISLDRAQGETEDLMNITGLDQLPNLRFASWREHLRDLSSIQAVTKRLEAMDKKTELLIIDGIGFLVKDIIKQREVGILFGDFDGWLRQNPSASVILIHHTAKAKEGQGYTNHREKGMGSGAWGQCSGVSISIASVGPDVDTDGTINPSASHRIAVVMSNNRQLLTIPFKIDDTGHLSVRVSDEQSEVEYSQLTGKSRSSFYRDRRKAKTSR